METLKKVGMNIVVMVLAVAILIVGELPQDLTMNLFTNYYLILIIPSILRIAATMALAWVVSAKLLKIDAGELGIKLGKPDIKLVLIAVALPVLVLVFYAFVLPGKAYVARPGEFWKAAITALFAAGIPAGICEELVFRGMIYRYMKKTLGTKIAIIVPSVLFACLHILNMEKFDIVDLIILIVAGSSVSVMFTMFAEASDSIYPGALAHAVWNALIVGRLFGIGDIVNGSANKSYIIIPVESSSKFLTGGNFGVEAAIPAILGYILAAFLIALFQGMILKKK